MKKLTSIILSFCLIISSVFLVSPVVTAEDNAAWAIQTSRTNNGNGSAIKYTDFDWDAFGENLITDPTVSHFEDGVYGKYATPDESWKPININPYYWWDKYLEESCGFTNYYQDMQDGKLDKKVGDKSYTNGFQSAANRSMTKTTGSLTDDGSGVLQTSSGGGFRAVALPGLESNKYYIIKLNVKCASAMDASVELCLEPDTSTNDLATSANSGINLGSGFAGGKVDTATFVVYTGSKTYENPFIRVYCQNSILTYFDDFGVYEVTEEYAKSCSAGAKLPEYINEADIEWAIQTSRNSSGSGIGYKGFNWNSYGENLVPDPTVSHFEDGVYGKYATPDENWKPTNINPYYWWDKYIEENNGFTMYYQDMQDGTRDQLVGSTSYINGFQSPANRSMPQKSGSLTDDGSGVLQMSSSGAARAVPLPKMEAYKYYVIKFNIKCASAMSAGVDLCLVPDTAEKDLINKDNISSSVNVGPGYAENKVETISYVVYTGKNTYNDPFIKIYCNNNVLTYLDDFGVYEVTEEYAIGCAEGTKLTEIPGAPEEPELPETECDMTAFGYRNNFSGNDCADSKNLITDSKITSSEYWNSDDGFAQISTDCGYDDGTSLKVSGNGTFKKLFKLEAETTYHLSLWGMGSGEPVSNISFGFMDVHGHRVENPLTEEEANDDVHSNTRKDNITIQCQDGSWYNRVYRFNTGNTTELYFFITGTVGTLYLDNIKLFKQSDAISSTSEISDLDINYLNFLKKKACDEQYNLIPNGDFSNGDEFWKDFEGYGESVEVVTADNNSVLHFKGQGKNCYYLPYVTVQPNIEYTYSYWAKNFSGSKSQYGVAALNNPLGFISSSVKISASVGSWKQYSVTFTVYTETKIAFAIYDVDGEAAFDKFRLFKSSNGKDISNDTPVDPVIEYMNLSIGENNEYKPQYENAVFKDYGTETYNSTSKYNGTSVKAPVSTLNAYSYYVISYWIKGEKNTSADVSYYLTSNSQLSGSAKTVSFDSEQPKRISMMIFTGGSNYSGFNIGATSNNSVEISDIQVVKLEDKEIAEMSFKENRFFILGDIDFSLRLDAGDLGAMCKTLLNDTVESIAITDVNKDTKIDVRDLVALKNILSNLK